MGAMGCRDEGIITKRRTGRKGSRANSGPENPIRGGRAKIGALGRVLTVPYSYDKMKEGYFIS